MYPIDSQVCVFVARKTIVSLFARSTKTPRLKNKIFKNSKTGKNTRFKKIHF